MKRYIVRVEETLARSWVVEAESEDEAYKKISSAHHDGEIVLDYDDYADNNIEVLREASEDEAMFYDIWE